MLPAVRFRLLLRFAFALGSLALVRFSGFLLVFLSATENKKNPLGSYTVLQVLQKACLV